MDIEQLIGAIQEYTPNAAIATIREAYSVAERAHAGQVRASGELYICHPLAVAGILSELHMDPPTFVAALLHDVPEDTEVSLETLREEFGEEVAKLVDGVTKLERLTEISQKSREEEEAESLRKMFLAMVEDVRVVLIKLADRLHNMRTLWALTPKQQARMAQETLEIFAPLANRLGIWQLKWELEDLALPLSGLGSVSPDRRTFGRAARRAARIHRPGSRLNAQELFDGRGHQGHASMAAPSTSIASIARCSARTGTLGRSMICFGIRVIVQDVRDCYAALGIIHSLWPPIPGEFDDYIAMPKDNMYQSLHTAVLGPEGKLVEFQIRTEEMHRIAEYGVAAHWRYKEGVPQGAPRTSTSRPRSPGCASSWSGSAR